MKRETAIRQLLINNAVHLIGDGGFEEATTKRLTHYGSSDTDIKMNEVYIYRLFGSKERLYEEAFIHLDKELFMAFQSGVVSVGGFEMHTKQRLCEFFDLAWDFILGNEERCRCYTRYYYSVYFRGRAIENHKRLFGSVIDAMSPLFKEEADVNAVLHSVFTTLFNFAISVYNGDIENNDVNRPHIFNVLYCMMMSYFKEDALAS